MSTEQLIASLVDSLAWPAAALVIVLVFRRQIAQLLSAGRLRRLKAGPLDLEFDRVSSEIETKLDLAAPLPAEHTPGTAAEALAPMLESSPASAVMRAFGLVEAEVRTLLDAVGFTQLDGRWGATGLARRAKAAGLITEQALEAVEGVAVLRNLAAHRPAEVSEQTAREYLALIDAVLFALRGGADGG